MNNKNNKNNINKNNINNKRYYSSLNKNYSIYFYYFFIQKKNIISLNNNNIVELDDKNDKIFNINEYKRFRSWKFENNQLNCLFKEYLYGNYEQKAYNIYLFYLGHYYKKPIKYNFILTNTMKIKSFLWLSSFSINDIKKEDIIELRSFDKRIYNILNLKMKYKYWKGLSKKYINLYNIIKFCHYTTNLNNIYNEYYKKEIKLNMENKIKLLEKKRQKEKEQEKILIIERKKKNRYYKEKKKYSYNTSFFDEIFENIDNYYFIENKIKEFNFNKNYEINKIFEDLLKLRQTKLLFNLYNINIINSIKNKKNYNLKFNFKKRKLYWDVVEKDNIENVEHIKKILHIIVMVRDKKFVMQNWLKNRLNEWNFLKLKNEFFNLCKLKNKVKKMLEKNKYLSDNIILLNYLKKKWEKKIRILKFILNFKRQELFKINNILMNKNRFNFVKSKYVFKWALWLRFYNYNKYQSMKKIKLKFLLSSNYKFSI